MTLTTLPPSTLDVLVRTGLKTGQDQRRRDEHASTLRVVRRLVANALAAGHDQVVEALAPPADRGVTVLSSGTFATPEQAAAANAAAITVTQCDEGLREARGHPGLHAFPAASAVVEERDGSLGEVLDATVVGWEVGARLGIRLGAPRDGVHPHGGWGATAAAAAAATALGLDDDGILAAVAIALTTALTGPDSSTYAGQATHYALPALGTANGVTAARLASIGVEPPDSALSHFHRIAYGQEPVPVELGPSLLELAYFKPIGVCAHALTAWEAAQGLAVELEPQDVVSVEVRTYAAAAKLAAREPQSALARQFSIPWVVASALLGRDPGDALVDEMSQLTAVTTVTHDASLDVRYPFARPAHLVVTTRQGRRHTTTAEFHRGDREQPLTDSGHEQVNGRLVGAAAARPDARDRYEALGRPIDTPWRQVVRHTEQRRSSQGRDGGREEDRA